MIRVRVLMTIAIVLFASSAAWAGTAFTYQGDLKENGQAANGAFNMSFSLWDAVSGGSQIGSTVVINGVQVTGGLFTVEVDFGANAFDNSDRWLQIMVSGTTLAPRQSITRSPYSIQTRGIFVNDNENIGMGATPSAARLRIHGNGSAIDATSSGNGSITIRGTSEAASGFGVFGLHEQTQNRGWLGSADYGVFGRAADVNNDWAGYFLGRAYVDDKLFVGRTNRIGSEYFGVHAPTSNFGGMYISTSGAGGKPFYGYSAGGDIDAYHYFDGDDDIWKFFLGSAHSMFVRTDGRVTFGRAPSEGAARVAIINNQNDHSRAMTIDHRGLGFALDIDSDSVGMLVTGRGSSHTAQFFNFGSGLAARFVGNVVVTGNLSKGSGSFTIDHPLDPENKYLSHSFVESPDMMNIYNGNVVTDDDGVAVVELPEYFKALNRDFRYQLTVIGTFAQAIVEEKIRDNRFVIRTSAPNIEVSWQVTGIRHHRYAEMHRIQVEKDKPADERGFFLHAEAYGFDDERAIGHDLIGRHDPKSRLGDL